MVSKKREATSASINRPQRLFVDGQALVEIQFSYLVRAPDTRDVSNALGDGREAGRRGVEHTADGSRDKRRSGGRRRRCEVLSEAGKGRERASFNRSRFESVRERERTSERRGGESEVEKRKREKVRRKEEEVEGLKVRGNSREKRKRREKQALFTHSLFSLFSASACSNASPFFIRSLSFVAVFDLQLSFSLFRQRPR